MNSARSDSITCSWNRPPKGSSNFHRVACVVQSGGDLVSTLEDLLRRLDNGRIARLDRVVIETTGLADPAPILHTIMLHPYLVLRYRLESVITLVDAVNGVETIAAHDEARRQVAVADRLVLTKTDLLDGSGERGRVCDVETAAQEPQSRRPFAECPSWRSNSGKPLSMLAYTIPTPRSRTSPNG